MMHNTVTVQNGNGRTYVSTRWALGIAVGLLVLGLGGWGKWVQATVIKDHDQLIRTMVKLDDIDSHIVESNNMMKVILQEHQMIMRAIQEGK